MGNFELNPEILKMCCSVEGWLDAFLNSIDYVEKEYKGAFNGDPTYWDIPSLQKCISGDLEDCTTDVGWLNIDVTERTECWDMALPMLASVSQPYKIELPRLPFDIFATSTHEAVIDLINILMESLYDLSKFDYDDGVIDEEMGVRYNNTEEEFIAELEKACAIGNFYNDIDEIKNRLKYELMRLVAKYGKREDLKVCYSAYPINSTRLSPEFNERASTIQSGNALISFKPQEFRIYFHIYHHPHCDYEEIKKSLDLVVEDETLKRYITNINKSITKSGNKRDRIRTKHGKQFIQKPSISELLNEKYGSRRTIHRRGYPDRSGLRPRLD